MKKFKLYFNLDKEEKWLNEMSSKGWELYGKTIKYMFRKTPHNNTNIKIDYRNFKSKSDFQDYITLFKDSGWEHITGTETSGKQYFKKIDETAGDDIFSDLFSKAERYKRMANIWMSLAVSCIPFSITLVLTKTVDITTMLNPKSLYYTPGLWQKTGASFWKAFLFETPFAIGRGFSWLLFPCLIIIYTIFAVKAQRYYQETTPKN